MGRDFNISESHFWCKDSAVEVAFLSEYVSMGKSTNKDLLFLQKPNFEEKFVTHLTGTERKYGHLTR
jgi:hypothetical protein